MNTYDIAIAGAGASGIMAAISASRFNKKIALIERNDCLGKKLLLTGNGRCNLTNVASINTFIDKFQKSGKFLRSAFTHFSNQDLIDFLKSEKFDTVIETGGRVFPAVGNADSLVCLFRNYLKEKGVSIIYNSRILDIKKEKNEFVVSLEGKKEVKAKKLILSTGGISYPATGSTGDGFKMAENLGHKITNLLPGLVPLKVKEKWVYGLAGIVCENLKITFQVNKKKILQGTGDVLFTHSGVSGPFILNASEKIASLLKKHKEIILKIDFKSELSQDILEKELLANFKSSGTMKLKNLMNNIMPFRFVETFLKVSELDPEIELSNIRSFERAKLITSLKGFSLSIVDSFPIETAMVTAGGVGTRQIDPKTLESKLVSGLYFAGEIIDGAGLSGGYNLQQAFSTGFLAGESASA